ncbi:MAG: DSD1 family PLP-dependent enzyme [Calditrichia bacterium]
MWQNIIRPTLLVSQSRVRQNIRRMVEKAGRENVKLRPHFKTHQSVRVGEWFREAGISHITVSSVEMAEYFAEAGWKDITIAFLLNPREIPSINRLGQITRPGILVEDKGVIRQLERQLECPVQAWLKVDAGYGRTGIPWQQKEEVLERIRQIEAGGKLEFAGLLSHFGNTYRACHAGEVEAIFRESLKRMENLKLLLEERLNRLVPLSIGDTPGCSICNNFQPAEEIRPGNFVYYDVMQMQIGSCSEEDIAVAVAAPVVALYPQRETVVVHAGAVHLSKESVKSSGREIFGLATFPSESGWKSGEGKYPVVGLSQEHGIIHMPREEMKKLKPGDLLCILPVHSCLTANLMKERTVIIQ